MVSEYLVSVVDSEDGAKWEAKAACGLCPQLGCRGRAPAGGLGVRGVRPPPPEAGVLMHSV